MFPLQSSVAELSLCSLAIGDASLAIAEEEAAVAAIPEAAID